MTTSPQASEASARRLPLLETRVLLGAGLTIAFVAGLIFRVIGQLALMPSRPPVTVAVFTLTAPTM